MPAGPNHEYWSTDCGLNGKAHMSIYYVISIATKAMEKQSLILWLKSAYAKSSKANLNVKSVT